MLRLGSAVLVAAVAVFAAGAQLVAAEPGTPGSDWHPPLPKVPGMRRVAVPTPASHFTHRPLPDSVKRTSMAEISPYLYLNRCTGGCTLTGGMTNDAMTNQTDIQQSGTYTIAEFANAFGQLGGGSGTCLVCPDSTHLSCSAGMASGSDVTCGQDSDCTTAFPGMNAYCETADVDWTAFMQCMTEVESYFALTVTDTVPAGGVAYTEGMIAGNPNQLNLGNDILGIAPILCDAPQDNAISFTFANYHPGVGEDRILDMCWTAGQETAHVWGLDHEYSYLVSELQGGDGSSACNDPMTYREDCGGEKFHRNRTAHVGTLGVGNIQVCRPTQNSYQMILAVFGAGTPIVPAPTASITFPAANAAVAANFPVDVAAGSKRGVWVLNLLLNGYQWTTAQGEEFGTDGQQNPATYTMVAPSGLPNGAYDVEVQACDDVGICGTSPVVKVMLGAACTSDAACSKGQHCNTGSTDNGMAPPGGCYWDKPTGTIGEKCTYPQFCESGVCSGTSTDLICTEDCVVGIEGQCPGNLTCTPTGGSSSDDGICFTASSSGCCSAAGSDIAWVPGGLSAFVLAVMLRRRRPAR